MLKLTRKIFWCLLFTLEFFHIARLGAAIGSDDVGLTVLKDLLTKATGFYVNPADNKTGRDLSKTVLITSCNYGYLNFLHNLKCFTDRLGLKVLVFSLDPKAHEYVSLHMPSMYSMNWAVGEKVEESSTEFKSHQFHVITTRKKEVVLEVLQLGYDVVFIDTDIALVRDPMPYLLWNNVDYVHSVNWICPHSNNWDFYKTQEEGNTGFYFVRSNERTIALFKTVKELGPKNPTLDDQTIFWEYVRKLKLPDLMPLPTCRDFERTATEYNSTVITCHLDGCLFSVGALRGVAYQWLQGELEKKHERAVTIHANYLKGAAAKMAAMEKHGYWLAEHPSAVGKFSGKCKAFSPPF